MFYDLESANDYTEIELPASIMHYRARFLLKDSVYRFQGSSKRKKKHKSRAVATNNNREEKTKVMMDCDDCHVADSEISLSSV